MYNPKGGAGKSHATPSRHFPVVRPQLTGALPAPGDADTRRSMHLTTTSTPQSTQLAAPQGRPMMGAAQRGPAQGMLRG